MLFAVTASVVLSAAGMIVAPKAAWVRSVEIPIAGLPPQLDRLRAPLGVFASTGNHEYIIGVEESLTFLRGAAGDPSLPHTRDGGRREGGRRAELTRKD